MLHPVLNSSKRARLLEIVDLQRQLIDALCALAPGSRPRQAWLAGVWPTLPSEWITRFWKNSKGKRARWIVKVAMASTPEKQQILDLCTEQLSFQKLYAVPAHSLTVNGWKTPAQSAVKKLLLSFYAPMFYKDEGFPDAAGAIFHKDLFIAGFAPRVRVCPYTDNYIQDTKLDHFFPKEAFPMLSCHPDNLIPCSTDPNSGGHKGSNLPMDPEELDQTSNWFHPRWRSAKGTFDLSFPDGPQPQPRIRFDAKNANDQVRLENMAKMFGLGEFWGGFLDDEVQNVSSDVKGWLDSDGIASTQTNVHACLINLANQQGRRIGKDGLAIVKSYFFRHIANTPILLAQVVRSCTQGM